MKFSGSAVLRGTRSHEAADLHLVEGIRNARQRFDAQVFRNLVEEIFDFFRADGGEHLLDVLGSMRNERHDQPSAARCAWYSAALSRPCGAPSGFMRTIQPPP